MRPGWYRSSRAALSVIGSAFALACAAAEPDIVVIVASKSSVTGLSRSQMTDIFLGRINRLSNGESVVPIDQAEGSAARDAFYDKLAGRSAAQMKAYWSKIIFTGRGQPPKEVSDSTEMKRQVAKDTATIGYIEITFVDSSLRIVP